MSRLGGIDIRFSVLVFLVVIFACNTSFATTIICDFKCNSNDDDSTMTHHAYFKEPQLEESGYKDGYKAGSLNYLVKGEINFSDRIEYYDGKEERSSNSTFIHNQTVDFNGTKGISEFYAKGFYPGSNRAISAFKKIRYDDINISHHKETTSNSSHSRKEPLYVGRTDRGNSTTKTTYSDRDTSSEDRYGLGEKNYYASSIKVRADVSMGPEIREGYDFNFKYNATVKDAVVETWDATGWTNRTGSRRIDWEQTALMKGNVTIQNDLRASGLIVPYGDINDEWLPCCFDGSHPDVENRDPSAVLKPDKLLPTKKLNGTYTLERINDTRYTINSTNPRNFVTRKLEDFTCDAKSCKGFECIYTYAPREGTKKNVSDKVPPPANAISVDKYVVLVDGNDTENDEDGGPTPLTQILEGSISVKNGSKVQYQIRISHDNSTISLMNINVTDILPEGLDYVEDSATFFYQTPYGDSSPEKVNSTRVGNNITWPLKAVLVNTGEKESHAYITFDANVTAEANASLTNTAFAEGAFGPKGGVVVSNTAYAPSLQVTS